MDQDSVQPETIHRKRQRKHTVDGSWLSSSVRTEVQPFNRKMFLRELGNFGILGKSGSELEREPQPELDLPGGAERIDARANSNAIDIVSG
jgi:hypothetical protein